MSRNYERDERERWRRQQQMRDEQDRWRSGGREREDDYGWRGEDRGWDRERRGSEEDYGMESRFGRREWNRDWNQGMGGGWNQTPERYRGSQWSQGGMQGQYSGRGPRNYKRQDSRIEEDINEQLTRHAMIDATDIEVHVQNGEVTLRGHVDSRGAKRLAEDIAESTFGVKDVDNQIKIQHEETPGRQRRAG